MVLGVVLLTIASAGCYTIRYSASASSRPVSFTGEVTGQRTFFRAEKWLWYALWGLAPLSDTDIEKTLIEPRTVGGAVQNLSITSEFAPTNVLLNLLTCIATICSKTVRVQGDLVR
jgi:hypothetical protein